ncbi:hypothetical protein PLESTB_000598100 [Pleodorina starrii]|uniref:Uncharacterized protein n=1 Tax=Pleodorina starrii TaxID=330485 RepID=A0A9W6F1E2_9CHLO|nr:hypothetical protein PLESTB_000598100 [Pleodorina starrii]
MNGTDRATIQRIRATSTQMVRLAAPGLPLLLATVPERPPGARPVAPRRPAQIIKPLSYTIRRYTASRPIAVATIDFLFMNVFTGTTANLTVEQWFRFDNYNRVAAADFTTDRYVEFTPALGVQAVFAANPNISASLLGGVCQAAATYCRTPSLQQYADVPTCLGFLSSVPFINPLRTQANSVMCRFLHSSLVRFAPEIHCPHIGPSGGGVCVDEPYSAFYTASPFPAGTFALM